MIEEAKKNHPELSERLFHKTLPNDLKFDKKFDGIYSIATLMHLSENDLKNTLSKIYNLLNQNGKFLMSISIDLESIHESLHDALTNSLTGQELNKAFWFVYTSVNNSKPFARFSLRFYM